MSVIVGAPGMMKKGTDKHIKKIPGSPSFYEIQKIALCGTVILIIQRGKRETTEWIKLLN